MIMDKDTKAIEEAKIRAKIFIENGWTEHEVEIFIKGFVEGSDWSIESAYHQPGDIPNENEIILCETKNGPMIAGPSHKDFKDTVEYFGITKWSYTNDIMPGRNSEPEKKVLHPKFCKGERVTLKPLNECMQLGLHFDIPFELKVQYKLGSLIVDDCRLLKNHIYYTLIHSQLGRISVPECFLESIEDSIQVPKINAVNAKYSIGQSVLIKSEGELRLLYGKKADLTDFIPYVNEVATIEDVEIIGTTVTYTIRRYQLKAIKVLEDAILYQVKDSSLIKHFQREGTGWRLEAQNLDTMQLDTSKLNPSPMETWKALFASVESFTSVASPQMRAYVAGQLYGLSERLMQEMLDILKETPASEK